jgi:hypothetical protein
VEYKAVEAAILDAINAADWNRLSAFGADTVVRLTRDNALLSSVSRHELDNNAWQALNDSCRHVLTAGPAELRRYLAQIDAGVLTDGDMDGLLVMILDALDHWTTFLETGERNALYELAIRSIELVDFQVEDADPVDFLAAPDMAAEYDRVMRALID